jgi:hypothetical protein
MKMIPTSDYLTGATRILGALWMVLRESRARETQAPAQAGITHITKKLQATRMSLNSRMDR